MTVRADNFERGAIDTFLIKGKDLGDLTHIVVRLKSAVVPNLSLPRAFIPSLNPERPHTPQ